VQGNVGGTERHPEVVAILAEPVGRGPRLAKELPNRHPVVLACDSDQCGQVECPPCRQVLRVGISQAGLKGSRRGHRDAGGLVDVTGPKEGMPKVVGAGRHQQRGLRLLNGREGTFGGDPGQFGLAHLGQRLRGDLVGLREDTKGAAPVVAGQLKGCALGVADEPGEQQASLFVMRGLVEAVRLVGVALQARQVPNRAIVHGDAECRGDHLVVGQCRPQGGDGAELDAAVGRERQRLSDEILDRDLEHLSEPDEHRHPVDVADATLDLAQPGL
jgi:hypothetical protein